VLGSDKKRSENTTCKYWGSEEEKAGKEGVRKGSEIAILQENWNLKENDGKKDVEKSRGGEKKKRIKLRRGGQRTLKKVERNERGKKNTRAGDGAPEKLGERLEKEKQGESARGTYKGGASKAKKPCAEKGKDAARPKNPKKGVELVGAAPPADVVGNSQREGLGGRRPRRKLRNLRPQGIFHKVVNRGWFDCWRICGCWMIWEVGKG